MNGGKVRFEAIPETSERWSRSDVMRQTVPKAATAVAAPAQ